MNSTDVAIALFCFMLLGLLNNIASWLVKIHRELVEIKNFSKADFDDRRRGMSSFD